jgi:hypothetical protein
MPIGFNKKLDKEFPKRRSKRLRPRCDVLNTLPFKDIQVWDTIGFELENALHLT